MRPPGRAVGAVRGAELAGVTTASGGDCAGGGSGDRQWCEVLGEAVVEVTRQEARVDVKAVWSAVALVVAAVLWAVAVVVLLRRIIRPQLASVGRGSFVNPDHVEQLRAMSVVDYRHALVTRLDALVLRRYRAVGLAADLLVAGFVPLLAAGVVAGLWSAVT